MKNDIAVNVEYEEGNTSDGNNSLTPEEREIVIQWADAEDRDKIFIYSSYQPIIRRLLKNPLFECQRKVYNKAYKVYPDPISVEGALPRKCLTIRTKLVKGRKLSPEERKIAGERLRKAREARK